MTDETDTIRVGVGETEGRTRRELIDDMALPFLDLAEKIEAAKLNGADAETWRAIFETNLFLWRFIANFLPRHFSEEVPQDAVELIRRISEYMNNVTVTLMDAEEKDPAVLDKVVTLNLNMCDQILAMHAQEDR
jgi:hypothetical protein